MQCRQVQVDEAVQRFLNEAREAIAQGLDDDAMELLEEALHNCTPHSRMHLSDKIDIFYAMGLIYSRKGEHKEAERKFLLACKLAERLRRTELIRRAYCLDGLYDCLWEQGRHMQALNVGLQALELRKDAFGEINHEVVQNLKRIGLAQNRLRDLKEAARTFSTALRILEQLPSDGDYDAEISELKQQVSNAGECRQVS
jgi:tetratricopeptide (TPR) repeat protein